jgi:hypothetical protein
MNNLSMQCNDQITTNSKLFKSTKNDSHKIFMSQMDYIIKYKPCQPKPKYFYGNQALSLQDNYNPLSYILYRQPGCDNLL